MNTHIHMQFTSIWLCTEGVFNSNRRFEKIKCIINWEGTTIRNSRVEVKTCYFSSCKVATTRYACTLSHGFHILVLKI